MLVYVAPTQLNFIVPSDMPMGAAQITVSTSSGSKITLGATFTSVNPGIATADGTMAVGQFVVGHAERTQDAAVSTTSHDQTAGAWKLVPSVWGATDQLFLILFATGIRHADAPGTAV